MRGENVGGGRGMRATGLAAVFAGLLWPPGLAADAPPPLPISAIGWLGHGGGPDPGRANCTGVLIAPDLVITADHCLTRGKDGTSADPRTLTFIAGLSGDESAARRRGAKIWLARAMPPGSAARAFGGLGLLRLESPIGADVARPVTVPPRGAQPGERLTVIGYPRTDQTHASVLPTCAVTHHAPPVVGLDCAAVSGFSGGAALALRDGEWTLGAVIVARARLAPDVRAIGLMPQGVIPAADPGG